MSSNLNNRFIRTTLPPALLGLKVGAKSVLVSCVPPTFFFFFSNRGKDTRIEEETTGEKAERCEVRKSAVVVAGGYDGAT